MSQYENCISKLNKKAAPYGGLTFAAYGVTHICVGAPINCIIVFNLEKCRTIRDHFNGKTPCSEVTSKHAESL